MMEFNKECRFFLWKMGVWMNLLLFLMVFLGCNFCVSKYLSEEDVVGNFIYRDLCFYLKILW